MLIFATPIRADIFALPLLICVERRLAPRAIYSVIITRITDIAAARRYAYEDAT